jgi:hypothetical protein
MKEKSKLPTEKSLQDITLIMAVNCVRNTIIEDYHAAGKLSDKEMKMFNKEVSNKLYTFLTFMFAPESKEKETFLRLMELFYPHGWDKPRLDKDMIQGLEMALHGKVSSD